MPGAQCLWQHCQVKSSNPQHKPGAAEVSSSFGTRIKRIGSSTESWVFSSCCALNGTVGHAPGILCLRSEWLLWNISLLQIFSEAEIKNTPTNLQMSQQAMAIHSFVSFYVKPFWMKEANSDNHKELLCKAHDYFSYLIIFLTCLYWYETSSGGPKHDNSTKEFVEFILS